MKHNYFVFLLILCSYFAQAQGFLGRKWIVKYNLHSNFATRNPTYREVVGINSSSDGAYQFISDYEEPESVKIIGLNKIHEIGVEYLYSRSHSVSFSGNFTRTSVNTNIYDHTYGIYLYNPFDLRVKLYSYNFEIKQTRYYENGGVAPLGTYRTWSLGVLGNSIYDRLKLENETKMTKMHDFTAFSLGLEMGRQKIYYDRYVFNFGVSSKIFFRKSMFVKDETLTENQHYLEKKAHERLFLQQLFNIKLGVGYLIK